MTTTVRWGVIGCGGIAARRSIPEVAAHDGIARITVVMDIRLDVARKVAARFSIPHACDKEEELLENDVDAVYIATPVQLHSAQAVRALQAGKHVLCEKPLCLTTVEAAGMRRTAVEAGVSLMPAYCMRSTHNMRRRASSSNPDDGGRSFWPELN
jgi:predicted dehydrogenase